LGWIQKRTREDHSEKISILPHTLDFPIHELKEFFFERRSQPLAQILNFLRNSRLSQSQKQAGLALEIAMNEAFGAASASRDFTSGSRFVSPVSKQLCGCHYERSLPGRSVPLSLGFRAEFSYSGLGWGRSPFFAGVR